MAKEKILLPVEIKSEGLRYNAGKVRHDLLEPFAINELAKVFTKGSEKYSDHNWLKGMKWSTMLASMKRHLNAYERGEDFDPETGLYHMAHVAWNALGIVSYYKFHPNLDDRFGKQKFHPNIGLDIDEVLADFVGHYDATFKTGIPHNWSFDKDMQERLRKLSKDKKWWMNVPAKIDAPELPFEPTVYVTSRVIPSEWTAEWLAKHGFPVAPVITVKHRESKLQAIKSAGADWFVDDNYKTFTELNNNGILCFLFDSKHNRRYEAGHLRIKHLNEVLK